MSALIFNLLRKSTHYLVFILFASTSMATTAETLSKQGVVAITSSSSNTLIVAYPRALYQLNTSNNSWLPITLPDPAIVLTGAAVNKSNGVIFIATQHQGILSSQDKGKNWIARNNGLAGSTTTALTQHAQQAETLYSIVPEQGIYRTEDAGENWLLMDAGPIDMGSTIIHSDMPDSMQTGWVFTATNNGVSRSMDCFCLWSQAGELQGEITALSYAPQQPKHIYAASGNSLYLTKDGGQNWAVISELKSTISTLHITASGVIYAGTQDGHIIKSVDNAQSWESIDGR